MRDLFRLLAALSSLCSPKNPRHDRAANVAASHAAADVEATGEATGEAAMAAAARLAVAEAAAAADAAAEAKAKAKAKAGFMTGAVFLLVLCVAPALNAQFSAGKLWLPTMGSAENVKLTLSPEFLVSVFGGAFPAKEEEQSPAPSFSVVHDAPDPQILVSMLDDTQRLLEDAQQLLRAKEEEQSPSFSVVHDAPDPQILVSMLDDTQQLLEDAQQLLLEANRKLAQACSPPDVRRRASVFACATGVAPRRWNPSATPHFQTRLRRLGRNASSRRPSHPTPPGVQSRAVQCGALDCMGLDWTGLDWIGLDWTGLHRSGLDWTGVDWTGLDWTGLDWTGMDSSRLDWTGLD